MVNEIKSLSEWKKHFDELIETKKNLAGIIPEETCLDLSEAIKNNPKMSELFEKIRNDNAQLRRLGKFWYQVCSELRPFIRKVYVSAKVKTRNKYKLNA